MRAPARSVIGAALLVATLAAAQTKHQHGPTMGSRGPSIAGSGPGGAGGPAGGGGTSGPPAPSWAPSMAAAWMLDETSGTRVNALGNTARDLSLIDGTDPTSSTDHMEGTRAMSVTASQGRHTSDTTWADLLSPVSVGGWFKVSAAGKPVMHQWDAAAGTFQLIFGGNNNWQFEVWDSTAATHTAQMAFFSANTGVWYHVVGTMSSGASVTLYVNGVQTAQTTMATATTRARPVDVGENASYAGLIDEVFVTNLLLSPVAICRICSCGLRGEQCSCSGAAYTSSGRNATACGSCTLPADCSAATPP